MPRSNLTQPCAKTMPSVANVVTIKLNFATTAENASRSVGAKNTSEAEFTVPASRSFLHNVRQGVK
jgi:hypothetical protein